MVPQRGFSFRGAQQPRRAFVRHLGEKGERSFSLLLFLFLTIRLFTETTKNKHSKVLTKYTNTLEINALKIFAPGVLLTTPSPCPLSFTSDTAGWSPGCRPQPRGARRHGAPQHLRACLGRRHRRGNGGGLASAPRPSRAPRESGTLSFPVSSGGREH